MADLKQNILDATRVAEADEYADYILALIEVKAWALHVPDPVAFALEVIKQIGAELQKREVEAMAESDA